MQLVRISLLCKNNSWAIGSLVSNFINIVDNEALERGLSLTTKLPESTKVKFCMIGIWNLNTIDSIKALTYILALIGQKQYNLAKFFLYKGSF